MLENLKIDLEYKQKDLYSSLPTNSFSRDFKNKPLERNELNEAKEKRKSLIEAMQKKIKARQKRNAVRFLK